MNKTELQSAFEAGLTPTKLDGFFHGHLELFLAKGIAESVVSVVLKVYLPWYGKEFDNKKNLGNNLVPSYLGSFVRSKFGEKAIVKRGDELLHVFPFKTKVTEGVEDKMKVLQLSYDLPENPRQVRQVVDELVRVEKNLYLGKAYIKRGETYRLIAFFSLHSH